MVDIMLCAQNGEEFMAEESATPDTELEKSEPANDESMEEGELPEEGEITDDEEPAPTPNRGDAPKSSRSKRLSASHSSSNSFSSRHNKSTKYKEESKQTKAPAESAEANGTSHRAKEDEDKRVRPAEDVDFREPREEDRRCRRRSSTPDDHVAKRPRVESPPPTTARPRRGPVKTKWTERTICKFFREGYCRDEVDCAYSHNAADSHRRPELCRYYQHGYCKKGLACPNLHGEFPCKAFHKGECTKEQCQFSHLPLNDYTQPIFDQILKDEELALKISQQKRPERRVLVPDGPDEFDSVYDPEIHNVCQPSEPLPPPSVVVPILSQPRPAPAQSYCFFNPALSSNSPVVKPPPQVHPVHPSPTINSPSPPSAADAPLSINDLLGKLSQPTDDLAQLPSTSIADPIHSLQSMFESRNVIDESPASPPPEGVVAGDSAPLIPTSRPYRAIPLIVPEPQLDLNLIQDLTSGLYKNDPRLKLMAEKQFDLVSKTLQMGGVSAIGLKPPSATALPPSNPAMPSAKPANTLPGQMFDPRSRDPRVRPAHGQGPLPGDAATEQDLQQMVNQQLRMVQQQQQVGDLDLRTGPPSSSAPQPSFNGISTSPGYDESAPYYERYDNRPPPGRYGGRRGHRDDMRLRRGFEDRYSRDDRYERGVRRPPSHQTSPRDVTSEPIRSEPTPQPAQPTSLREKRKDNVYESPLAPKTSRF